MIITPLLRYKYTPYILIFCRLDAWGEHCKDGKLVNCCESSVPNVVRFHSKSYFYWLGDHPASFSYTAFINLDFEIKHYLRDL